jgi:tRNA(Met) cytidine acetyltransferase
LIINQRQCVILQGDRNWCQSSSQVLLANFDKDKLLCLSNYTDFAHQTIRQQQAQKYLGKEFDAVIFDALDDFNPDSFGAIVGTIKAGGALIVFMASTLPDSLWLQRFHQIAIDYSTSQRIIQIIKQGDNLPTLTISKLRIESTEYHPTCDQQVALEGILSVVHGHRRRPLVLSSDRGRGKSAVLGMAAATLIKQGKTTIVVTAPSLATVDTVFEHAAYLLPGAKLSKGHLVLNNTEIKFIAPDALIESDQKADLLLVDEAAAIPAPMLEKLLHKFSRIVFSTTLHGYEGTGLGFAIRFRQILEQYTPNWHRLRMTKPIRWSENDRLEAFSFKALLLDASPVDDALIEHCQSVDCVLEKIDRKQLINDETSLAELFGLMVFAHYRTRPSDLQLMLDREDVSVYVMRYQGHIVASAWLVNEGGLDDELAKAIHGGTRRLKGQLLPQSLLAHVGVTNAGLLKYQRIIRLAVHPVIQQRGIGHFLLNNIVSQLKQSDLDIVGTSFAVSVDLLNFWSKSHFTLVRIGLQQDDVSGSHSVMMLQAVSKAGKDVVSQAQQRIQHHWSYLVPYEFKHLEAALIIKLSAIISAASLQLSIWDTQDILAFCQQQRSYESCRIALSLWLAHQVKQVHFEKLSTIQQQLSIMILQQREWPDIGKRLCLNGKMQIINALRDVVALLNSYDELG